MQRNTYLLKVKFLISKFYTIYGVQIYKNANCSQLFVTYINTSLQSNYTYAQIEQNYHYLCGVNCPLSVCSFPNCFLLQRAYDKFMADNGGHPYTLPNCQDSFVHFFNTYFGLSPAIPPTGRSASCVCLSRRLATVTSSFQSSTV